MIRNPDVHLSDELLEALKEVSVPTATNALLQGGFRNTYAVNIQPLAVQEGQVMVGRVRSLRFLPLREDLLKTQYGSGSVKERPHRLAIESIQPGEVLVIDAGGCLGAAVVGDMYTRRVYHRGGAGIVIDGVVRDLEMIRTVGLPVFCRGMYGTGIGRLLMSVGIDEPIQIGGVPVLPGDVVLGSRDGVIFIPPTEVEAVVEYGLEHDLEERFSREKLAEGYPLHRAYPPDAELRQEYEEWRKKQ